MKCKCPITKKYYERYDSNEYHNDDCLYCNGKHNFSMKKVLTILLLSLFMISTVSAMNIDNIMKYDKQSDTITFENRWGVGLIGGGKIVEATLEENICEDNRYCHAIKTIKLFEDGQLIQDFKTLRIDDGSWEK